MSDREIVELAKLVEKQVVAALIAQGHVEHEGTELTFTSITPKTKLNLKEDENKDQEFLDDLRKIFPRNYTCSTDVLSDRLRKFYGKTKYKDITKDEILEAAEMHVSNNVAPYFGKLYNFIYKIEGGTYTSRLEDLVLANREILKEAKTVTIDTKDANLEGWRL